RATVHRHALQRRQIDSLQTAHVDRRGRFAAAVGAKAEGRAAAGGTKVMSDDVLVERIDGKRIFRTVQRDARTRQEPQQVALTAAMRAVAFDHLLEIAVRLERNAPAMALALIPHDAASRRMTQILLAALRPIKHWNAGSGGERGRRFRGRICESGKPVLALESTVAVTRQTARNAAFYF